MFYKFHNSVSEIIRRKAVGVVVPTLVAVGLIACSSTQKAADTSTPATGGQVSFHDMSHEQQEAYMKDVVLPQMSTLFQEHNAQEFAGMDCTTCHGAQAKEHKFEMPNPELPALNPADNFKEGMEKHPMMTEFMMQKVVPTMAALLHEEPYNPQTQKGFGCFDCHTMAK